MKNIRAISAMLLATAMLMLGVPATPAQADGAASTRNIILLGGAAATYLIIQHNRKVHEQQAKNAQRQAAAEEQRDDSSSAYQQAEHAYREEVAVNAELQKQIAYQDKELSIHDDGGPGSGATVSYGWGNV
jgi:hypothetical protein